MQKLKNISTHKRQQVVISTVKTILKILMIVEITIIWSHGILFLGIDKRELLIDLTDPAKGVRNNDVVKHTVLQSFSNKLVFNL